MLRDKTRQKLLKLPVKTQHFHLQRLALSAKILIVPQIKVKSRVSTCFLHLFQHDFPLPSQIDSKAHVDPTVTAPFLRRAPCGPCIRRKNRCVRFVSTEY